MKIRSDVKNGNIFNDKPNNVTIVVDGKCSISSNSYIFSELKNYFFFIFMKECKRSTHKLHSGTNGGKGGSLRVYINQHLALSECLGAEQTLLEYISFASAIDGTHAEFFYNCRDH